MSQQKGLDGAPVRQAFCILLGIVSLLAERLKPARAAQRLSWLKRIQRRGEQAGPWVERNWGRRKGWLHVRMRAAERTTVALLAAINVPLIGLWVAALTNVYAEQADVRCGALAMASFAAENLRGVVILTGVYWAISALLRAVLRCAKLPIIFGLFACLAWLFVETLFLGVFLWAVFFGQAIIDHLPEHFPPYASASTCRERFLVPKTWLERELEWHLRLYDTPSKQFQP